MADRPSAALVPGEGGDRQRESLETMSEGFALHGVISDEQGKPRDYRFLEINPTFERLTGIAQEAVVGRTSLEILPGFEPYWIER